MSTSLSKKKRKSSISADTIDLNTNTDYPDTDALSAELGSAEAESDYEASTTPDKKKKKKTAEKRRKVKLETVRDDVPESMRLAAAAAGAAPSAGLPVSSSRKFVGAHLSVSGGPANAIHRAISLGANALALFTRNQRIWKQGPLKKPDIDEWHNTVRATGFNLRMVLPHGSYLINAGSPEPDMLSKSREALLDEVGRCQTLGISLYNFHPGSTKGEVPVEQGIRTVAETVNFVHARTSGVTLVLENTAGGGSTLGRSFEELQQIIKLVQDKSRIGVCLDTCHLFAAGYDVSTRESFNSTLEKFDRIVGLKYLRGIHLNDSKEPLHSNKDRHENIGKGKIGLECFRALMHDPRLNDIPMVLETPDGDYAEEIRLLRSLEKAAPQ